MSYNSCISVRLGQVAPDDPLATHMQAEASMFTIQRKKVCLCAWSQGCRGEWAGRELEASEVRKNDRLLFTSLPQSSMQIQIHFKSEDIDISSAMLTLRNEIIHISIENIHTKKSFCLSLLPRKRTLSYHLSDLTEVISGDLPKVIKHNSESLDLLFWQKEFFLDEISEACDLVLPTQGEKFQVSAFPRVLILGVRGTEAEPSGWSEGKGKGSPGSAGQLRRDAPQRE